MTEDVSGPLIDWLSYRSYEHNRCRSPHIPYYKWRKLYTQAIEFEEIYDNHLKNIYLQGDKSHVTYLNQ